MSEVKPIFYFDNSNVIYNYLKDNGYSILEYRKMDGRVADYIKLEMIFNGIFNGRVHITIRHNGYIHSYYVAKMPSKDEDKVFEKVAEFIEYIDNLRDHLMISTIL